MVTEQQLSGFRLWGRTTRDWTDTTQRSYSQRVRATDRWFAEHAGGINVELATAEDLDDWYAGQSAHPGTRNQYRSALVAFYEWMVATGQRDDNPAEPLPTHRKRRAIPKALVSGQADALLVAAEATGQMWHTLVTVLLYGALRVSEARHLEWADIEWPYMRVLGKGQHERMVPIAPPAAEALRSWEATCPSPRWVFPSPLDPYSQVGYTTVHTSLRSIGEAAGVHGLHPHVLRHTCATALIDAGVDIRTVQEILGHSSIQTTTIYLRVRPAQLVDAVGKLSFRERPPSATVVEALDYGHAANLDNTA